MSHGGSGYAAILARLRAPQLRTHCDDALRMELLHVQHQLQDARAAMLRLRDVSHAATSLGSAATTDAVLLDVETTQRELGRAVAACGVAGSGGTRVTRSAASSASSTSSSFVCSKCRSVETMGKTMEDDAPLLTTPDAAALSPPRRHKTVTRANALPRKRPLPVPRRKLVIPRKKGPATDDEETTPEPSTTTQTTKTTKTPKTTEPTKTKEPTKTTKTTTTTTTTEIPPPAEPATPKKEKPKRPTKHEDVKSESDDVVIVEDESDSDDNDDDDDQEQDVRQRLQTKIDACWPLATELGALEMPQRRLADYADLVRRVAALFRTLLACAVDDMASRSMRSVLVKARDALAVAVSLVILHDVTDANASIILALVKAVDAASEKHSTLQKHVAPFRNSLADLEVALLTRHYVKPTPPDTKASTPRKKPRSADR